MFTLNKYQQLASRTLIKNQPEYDDLEKSLIWNALGLAGESGEVVDAIKKQVCHNHGIDRGYLVKEMGDVLWYLAALATSLDIDLEDIALLNIEKLKQRYPDGFNTKASLDRVDKSNQ